MNDNRSCWVSSQDDLALKSMKNSNTDGAFSSIQGGRIPAGGSIFDRYNTSAHDERALYCQISHAIHC